MRKDFYIYAHHRKSDGSIFYIGKGVGRRASNPGGRSLYWRRVVAKYGHTVRIVKKNMPEQCAFSLERALIAAHGRGNLANLSDGGEGVTGITASNRRAKAERMSFRNSPTADRKRFEFYHANYGLVKAPKCLFRKAFGLQSTHISRLASGKSKTHLGWSLAENKHQTPGKSGPNKSNLAARRAYRHADGSVWEGHPYYFIKEYNLNVGSMSRLHKGEVKSHKGWSLA